MYNLPQMSLPSCLFSLPREDRAKLGRAEGTVRKTQPREKRRREAGRREERERRGEDWTVGPRSDKAGKRV